MPLKKAPHHRALTSEELKWRCDTSVFDFEDTKSIKPIEGIVGQERALKALKIGVELRSPGYNIFVTGLSGTGKLTTIKKMLESIAPAEDEKLFDYAYVNNFKDIDRPILLKFKAGQAKKFRNELKRTIRFLQERIPNVLNSEPFVSRKKQLLSEYGKQQRAIMTGFEEKLRKDNFTLGEVKSGEMVRPEILALIDNKPVFVQQIQEFVREGKINSEKANEIISKYSSYQEELQQIFVESLKLTQMYQEKINQLETESVSSIVKLTIEDLRKKYKDSKIRHYLDQVTENILLNIEIFKGQKPIQEEAEDGTVIDYLKEYEVNIILDNSNTKATPVIIETSPTYTNLFGTIEKINDGRGGWYADFTRIKAGSILRANGGFLVINALDALGEPGVWKALKRTLLYGKLEIQDIANVYQFSPSILKPEPIEIDTKIILIGNNYIYSYLSFYEDDFNKIFKIKAEFDNVMKRSESALNEYARLIKKLIENEKLYEFDKSAVARLIEYGARYAGEKNKLTTRFAYIADLVREANFWAKDNGSKIVTDYHVDQAYNSYIERHGLYESKISEFIEEGTILIDTEGARIGTVNGLAVYDVGVYSFGKPTRITATVSLGNGSIINVEREAGLSGKTHNKAVLIISGYFREKFGRSMNLSFNANLVFEQGYSMVDGDSASISEICALLSALSGVPIKQSLAITGSVNQKGEIQPIGGVNEKIEGFFDVCKKRGLNGSQGVIIPHQNVKDLMLKDEVVNAVKEKRFHIYAVKTVEEAVEILTGIKAGKLLKTGKHEVNTLFYKVEKELESMLKKSKQGSRKN
ncbi:Lon protease family protein [Melioribacter sp. OK-6-Me]|uniref:Lon protease family protein n=1 Tax=unclassified Melioribacter TaxID=2627329 RepID=UPI003ED8EF85